MADRSCGNRDHAGVSRQIERKTMYNRFDELTKSLAQSVTRRGALKKFGAGLAGMALACFGLASKAGAAARQGYCQVQGAFFNTWYTGACMDISGCVWASSSDCP